MPIKTSPHLQREVLAASDVVHNASGPLNAALNQRRAGGRLRGQRGRGEEGARVLNTQAQVQVAALCSSYLS